VTDVAVAEPLHLEQHRVVVAVNKEIDDLKKSIDAADHKL